jgi:arylformamidase
MSRVIELGHPSPSGSNQGEGLNAFSSVRAMVLKSVGPIRHEVSVPFHDSQVRGAALLIQTAWDQRWDTEAYWEPGPFLAEHLIFRMVRSGVRIVGVDFPISDRTNETRLVTTGKIPVVENLHGLSALPRTGFRFSVIPLGGSSGAPLAVRAFAEIG